MNEPRLIRICGAQVKELTGVSAGGMELVVVPTAKGPKVFDGRCPHQGTLLSEGQLADGVLVCRAHGWKFDASNGKRCDGAGAGLTEIATISKPDGLYVDASVPDVQATAKKTLDDVPGPTPWPVLGNVPQLQFDRLHLDLESWEQKYGSTYALSIGSARGLVVSDPGVIEQVLRARPNTFRRPTTFEQISKEVGTYGVFSAEGESWRRQRKLATESLSQRHFDRFFPALLTSTERLRTRWQKSQGTPVEVLSDLTRLTVDVTTGLAFGIDMNTLEKDDEAIQTHLQHVLPAVGRRAMAPFAYWRVLRMPADRQLDRSLVALREILNDLIAKARGRLEALPESERVPTNFLEAMIVSRDDAGQPFDDEIIFGNTLTMLIAGEDTTASSIAFAMHELCERPEVQAKAREEIAAAVGPDGLVRSLVNAQALPWLDAIAYETLRFRAVAPFLLMEAIVDTTVGEVAVKKGTPVYLLTRLAGVRSAQFADPGVFRPQRWLDKQHPHTGFGYTPFGAGPRLCPGRSLALLEMRVVLAMVLHAFDLAREGHAADVLEHWAFTVFPKNLKLKLTARQ